MSDEEKVQDSAKGVSAMLLIRYMRLLYSEYCYVIGRALRASLDYVSKDCGEWIIIWRRRGDRIVPPEQRTGLHVNDWIVSDTTRPRSPAVCDCCS